MTLAVWVRRERWGYRILKKAHFWIVAALVATVSAMVAVHWNGMRVVQSKVALLDTVSTRQEASSALLVSLEKYRRQSKGFRTLSSADHTAVKTKLSSSVNDTIARLEKLAPTEEERKLGAQAIDQVSQFMVLTAKLEPWLFTKDVFQKPEAVELFEALGGTIAKLRSSADVRAGEIRAQAAQAQPTALKLQALGAVVAVSLVLLLLFRNHFAFARPIQALRNRALELREGKLVSDSKRALSTSSGVHGEIDTVMGELAHLVDKQRKEREQFITAVASDLRAPLVSLQAGAHLLASVGDQLEEVQRQQAAQSVRRAIFRLSRSLDDLTDIVDLERTDIRLDEKIVDLRDLVHGVTKMLGSNHEITPSTPPVPIWTLIDSQRMERVLVNVISKMMQYLPQGGRIDVSMVRPADGKFRGVEILIQDGTRLHSSRGIASGPEQDVLRHWVSENGFGMALAQKIMKSHGGSITASGVVGSSVLFTIRIPQERVASGLVSQPSQAQQSQQSHHSHQAALAHVTSRIKSVSAGQA
jgi:signal transduction histidine kinase